MAHLARPLFPALPCPASLASLSSGLISSLPHRLTLSRTLVRYLSPLKNPRLLPSPSQKSLKNLSHYLCSVFPKPFINIISGRSSSCTFTLVLNSSTTQIQWCRDCRHLITDPTPSALSNKSVISRMPESKAVIGLSWEPKLSLLSAPKNGSDKSQNVVESSGFGLWKADSELVDGLFVPPNNPRKLNKLLRKQVKDTTGTKWFDMPAPTITPELKKDLQLLKLRSAIDPKRHYKKGDSKSKTLPKYFQVGTVVESASEFFSGRLTNKERKTSLADELLSNTTLSDYRKRKIREIEERNRPGGVDKWRIKGKQSWKRKKQRRH